MRRVLVFVAMLGITAVVASRAQQQSGQGAQDKPEQKPSAQTAPNVAGKWTMTLDMSMGTGTPTLELKQDGEKITGTYTGRYGTFPLEGKLKERTIEFSVTMTAEDQSVKLIFSGEVAADGQTMKGTATLGELGDATWSAKREKVTDPSIRH